MARLYEARGVWMVPSESGKGDRYKVSLNGPSCTCPDFELHGGKCKHIYAVEYARRRESDPDGEAPFATMPVQRAARKTYPQYWRAYNVAQTHEKEKFQVLLRERALDVGALVVACQEVLPPQLEAKEHLLR